MIDNLRAIFSGWSATCQYLLSDLSPNHTQSLPFLPRRLLTLSAFRIGDSFSRIRVIIVVPRHLSTMQIFFQPVRRPVLPYLAFLQSYLK